MSGTVLSFLSGIDASGAMETQVVSAANPLPVTFGGGGAMQVTGTLANGVAGNPFPVITGGRDGTGTLRTALMDAAGDQLIAGNVASGAADTGNPVKAGGVFNSTLPTFTTGQRGDLQIGARGSVNATLFTQDSTSPIFSTNTVTDNTSTSRQALWTFGYSNVFNGVGWDRNYKPRTAFRLPSSAATTNAANIKTTAGSVLQISANVTLAGSTCYLKLFDTTGVPNPAALNPLYIFALNIVNGFVSISLPAGGLYFPTGIGVAIVANPADLDNTAIAAGQVTALNIGFQ